LLVLFISGHFNPAIKSVSHPKIPIRIPVIKIFPSQSLNQDHAKTDCSIYKQSAWTTTKISKNSRTPCRPAPSISLPNNNQAF
jgi:hypothetical protein